MATAYVALLRGINVGGRNKVPMATLRATFEDAGFGAVRTYIQSGNVLFTTDAPRAPLESTIEAVVEQRFGFPIVVVVRSLRQLRAVVANAPPGFGRQPDRYHSDVVFLKAPLRAAQAMKVVALRDGVDQAWPGSGPSGPVIYFARLRARRVQSRMSRMVGTPEYRLMTIRNWATTTKLLSLLEGPDP